MISAAAFGRLFIFASFRDKTAPFFDGTTKATLDTIIRFIA